MTTARQIGIFWTESMVPEVNPSVHSDGLIGEAGDNAAVTRDEEDISIFVQISINHHRSPCSHISTKNATQQSAGGGRGRKRGRGITLSDHIHYTPVCTAPPPPLQPPHPHPLTPPQRDQPCQTFLLFPGSKRTYVFKDQCLPLPTVINPSTPHLPLMFILRRFMLFIEPKDIMLKEKFSIQRTCHSRTATSPICQLPPSSAF